MVWSIPDIPDFQYFTTEHVLQFHSKGITQADVITTKINQELISVLFTMWLILEVYQKKR